MINHRISPDWSTTKPIASFSCKQRVQEVHTKAENTQRNCIAKRMMKHRIFADWSKTKPIAAFSSTPFVQELQTKAKVVHLTPCLLGLGVLFNCHA